MTGKMQPKVAEGLKHLLTNRIAEKPFLHELGGVGFFAVKDQLPDLWQRVKRARANVIVRLAGPERVLVELDPLVNDPTHHHRAQPAVADGQAVNPLASGLSEPDLQIVRFFGSKRGMNAKAPRCQENESKEKLLHPSSS